MLVLTRKTGERIVIAGAIVLEVLKARNDRVQIGVQAPRDVPILSGKRGLSPPPCFPWRLRY